MPSTNTPRDLDPKFRDTEPVEEKTETPDIDPREHLRLAQNGEVANDPNEGEIVHIQRIIDSAGNLVEKQHRVPRSDWADYSAKNGL